MSARLAPPLLIAALLLIAVNTHAKDAPPPPDDRPVLAIIVSENLQSPGSSITDFDRLDMAFQQVARERKWPVRLVADRFMAGVPDYETEVRIFSQPIRKELPDEYVYRAWVSVYVQGTKKHDFGIITHRYYPRLGENVTDSLDKIFLGFARAAAGKFEPLLFPQPDAPKS